MKKYEAILFDMGYTLIYFDPSPSEIARRAYAELGLEVDPKRWCAAWDEIWEGYLRQAATATFEASEEYDRKSRLERERRVMIALGIYSEEKLWAFLEKQEAIYRQPGTVRLFPETKSVLENLRSRGFRLGIISNWGWDLPDFCKVAGITDYFEIILSSAQAGCSKPNPLIFQKALDKMKLPPERALYVGDSYEVDVVGARSAGLEAILIDRSEGTARQDCLVIRNLEELLPLLE